MLAWTMFFLILTFVAGTLGFTDLAIVSTDIAQLTFFVFLTMFAVSAAALLFPEDSENSQQKQLFKE